MVAVYRIWFSSARRALLALHPPISIATVLVGSCSLDTPTVGAGVALLALLEVLPVALNRPAVTSSVKGSPLGVQPVVRYSGVSHCRSSAV